MEHVPTLSQFMTPDQVIDHVTGQVTFHRPFLCLFTYVWSLDLFWKLYIVLTLRELTSLSQNINYNSPGDSFRCHDPVTGGPALSPSQGNSGSISVPWG